MIPAFRKNAGFSLIELSILLTIVSLLAAAMMQDFREWRIEKISGDTESRKTMISNTMTLFLTNYGRLPCPADPSLPPDSPTAGYEACPATYGGAVGQCNGASCRVAGMRDTTLDTDSNMDPVLTGAVPFAALGLSAVDAVDGWTNKMTYAVSEYLTNSSTNRGNGQGVFATGASPVFDDQMGVIQVLATAAETVPDATAPAGFRYTGVTQPPNNATNPDFQGGMPNTFRSFMVVVVSHGADGKGAYSYGGRLNVPCASVAGYDQENCDGDAVFVKADKGTQAFNNVPGATFFDDAFTIYRIRRDSDKWAAYGTSSMQNKTGGRVGIGNSLPSAQLDVGGNIKLDNFIASDYCSSAGNCFKPTMIAGGIDDTNPLISAAHCGTAAAPMLMKGVNGAAIWKVDCVDTVNTTGITPGSCDPGKYMTGIDATGNITCALP